MTLVLATVMKLAELTGSSDGDPDLSRGRVKIFFGFVFRDMFRDLCSGIWQYI